MVCDCGVWVERGNIQGHLTQTHFKRKSEVEDMNTAMTALGASFGKPKIPGNQDFIPGLVLHRAFQCGIKGCPVVMKAADSQRVHRSMCHQGSKAPWEACPAQRLNRSDAKTFFRVAMPVGERVGTTVHEVVADILKDTKRRRSEEQSRVADEDNRVISPWLITNKWPEIVGDRAPQEVRDLVDNVKDIPNLSDDLWRLVMKCSAVIRVTPQLLLERLNTSRPEQ